jgi:hypothetical protein
MLIEADRFGREPTDVRSRVFAETIGSSSSSITCAATATRLAARSPGGTIVRTTAEVIGGPVQPPGHALTAAPRRRVGKQQAITAEPQPPAAALGSSFRRLREAGMQPSFRRITIMGAALALLGAPAALAASAAWAAPPPNGPLPAHVYVDNATLYVMAQPGVANQITVNTVSGQHIVTDSVVTPIPGAGCALVPPQPQISPKIVCDPDLVKFLYVDLGDGSDSLGVRGTLVTIPTTLIGGPGNDTIEGGDGDDAISGGEGNDTMYGWWGDDTFSGGTEVDTVSYGTIPYPVVADADGAVGDDGTSLEHDTIMSDVENIVGGKAADILIGNAAANLLAGGPGSDVLIGLEGDDLLLGEDDYDFLFGLDKDTLRPAPGTDDICLVGEAEGGEAYGCATVR